LFVDGTIASTVAVGTNAVLGGTGTIGGAHNAGRVAPGASIGTLSVSGDFVQDATGSLEIELDDRGNVDVLAVSGRRRDRRACGLRDRPREHVRREPRAHLSHRGERGHGHIRKRGPRARRCALTTVYRRMPCSWCHDQTADRARHRWGAGEGAQACAESLEQRRRGASGDALTTLSAITRLPVDELAAALGSVCVRDPTALRQ